MLGLHIVFSWMLLGEGGMGFSDDRRVVRVRMHALILVGRREFHLGLG